MGRKRVRKFEVGELIELTEDEMDRIETWVQRTHAAAYGFEAACDLKYRAKKSLFERLEEVFPETKPFAITFHHPNKGKYTIELLRRKNEDD